MPWFLLELLYHDYHSVACPRVNSSMILLERIDPSETLVLSDFVSREINKIRSLGTLLPHVFIHWYNFVVLSAYLPSGVTGCGSLVLLAFIADSCYLHMNFSIPIPFDDELLHPHPFWSLGRRDPVLSDRALPRASTESGVWTDALGWDRWAWETPWETQAEVRAEREVWLGLEAGSKRRTGFQTQRS